MVNTVRQQAFVDESRRKDRYLLVVAIINPGDLTRLRKLLRSLLLPGQKEVHFKKEDPSRRRIILSRLLECGPVAHVYQRSCVDGEERAREDCLTALVLDLKAIKATRLVLDSREERDEHDLRTIRKAFGKSPRSTPLVYEHMWSSQEELLWIADVVGWCYGAGGEWRRRVMPVVARAVDLDTWSG